MAEEPRFPKFDYLVDESDPDVVVLRRQDGSFVAAFGARGATKETIVEAAREDYRALLEVHGLPGGKVPGGEERRSGSGTPSRPAGPRRAWQRRTVSEGSPVGARRSIPI
jgi:hypothetical protein